MADNGPFLPHYLALLCPVEARLNWTGGTVNKCVKSSGGFLLGSGLNSDSIFELST